MIYVLDGVATVIEDGVATDLSPGQAATFKAGGPVGHHLENRSEEPVRYLVIGTRSGDDVVRYTDDGGTVTVKDGQKTYRNAAGEITRQEAYQAG